MNFSELINHINLSEDNFRFDPNSIKELGGHCLMGGYSAIPIVVSPMYDKGEDIEVVDQDGSIIGVICCCRGLEVDLPSTLTDFRYVAYITDIPFPIPPGEHIVRSDYAVIGEDYLVDFEKLCLPTAPIWGGFVLQTENLDASCRRRVSRITAISDMEIPANPYHMESAIRSVLEPFAFERFLKLYHLLELLFDLDVVKEIRAMGDDLEGIGQIFHSLIKSPREVNRLGRLFLRYNSVSDVGGLLDGVFAFADKGKIIFFDYGKEGNPLERWETLLSIRENGGFTQDSVCKTMRKKVDDKEYYERFLSEITAYWIYRVRCCIAHNRIGEYVMTRADEAFVVEFAEPLLRAVLRHVFRKRSA